MANEFYQPGEQRAEQVNRLFDRIAARYDLINDVQSFGLHRWWKRRLIQLSGADSQTHALDLCCGTGDIAFGLARRGARVTGLDFSQSMLQQANRRLPPGLRDRVQFIQGDALHLPFDDRTFNVVTIGYGLRNLADYAAGLAEMKRVLKPGGRLLVLDFGKPEQRFWRAVYFGYLGWVVPIFGRCFCGDSQAYAYILESLRHYPAQNGVKQLMEQLQFEQIAVHNYLGGMMSINYGELPV